MDTRVTRVFDVFRLGRALSHPGIDPRSWVSVARVETDPDSITWDDDLGYTVDVECYGGELDGETDITCRVLTPIGDAGAGDYTPPTLGAECAIMLPSGDPDASPVLLGYVRNTADSLPPTSVHDLPIDNTLDASTDSAVSPFDTAFLVSPWARREDYTGPYRLRAQYVVLGGTDSTDTVRLGGISPTESVVRGDAQLAQLTAWFDDVLQILTDISATLALPPYSNSAITASVTALTIKYNTVIKPGLRAALSTKVKTE